MIRSFSCLPDIIGWRWTLEKKKLIAYINAENELADSILRKAENYERVGADELFIYNYSLNEGEREEFLLLMRQIAQTIDLPLIIGFNVKRLEDDQIEQRVAFEVSVSKLELMD